MLETLILHKLPDFTYIMFALGKNTHTQNEVQHRRGTATPKNHISVLAKCLFLPAQQTHIKKQVTQCSQQV